MYKKLLFLVFLLLNTIIFVPNIYSAPIISSVPGSAFDGSAFTIAGSKFGVNPLDFEWLGDNIESGQNGAIFSKLNWTSPEDSSVNYAVRYSNKEKNSGNKSLFFRFDDIGSEHYDSFIVFDSKKTLNRVYVTFWVKFNPITSDADGGQWKVWRITDDSGGLGGKSMFTNSFWYNTTTSTYVQGYYFFRYNITQSSGVGWVSTYPPINKWYRIEAWVQRAIGENVADGQYTVTLIDKASAKVIASTSGFITHSPTDGPWRYLSFGQYWGNIDEPINSEAYVWFDDIYIGTTRARVEIGNNKVWSMCTHREIQVPKSWSDNFITVTFNKGSFLADTTVYLFVIDADGNVNSEGLPVTIISSGNEPSSPKGLRIVP